MIKQNKTKLPLILSALFFAGVLAIGCNNGSESEKAEKKDTAAVPAPAATEVKKDSPAIANPADSGALKGNPKPTPEKP